MIYRLLADAVLLLHLGFIVFALLGGLLVCRRRGWLWWHLPAAAWAMAIELSGGICPLTPLENRLRALGGAAGYPGGFVEHYLLALIYPEALTRALQLVLAGLVLAVNLAVYGYVIRRWRRGQPPGG
ncbi:DUF2784 domain-containing protein [Pseudogulbenkiania subflava]|uniref:DUF2784 domain-containing protein n=1 Tax=Pseudogulbenkiania subflava DSM 22618 TaxID=1123014 RepID=A0A1Y6B9X0_9NEIS|nr:DUF2784 domain-containing protein [Pseudogulbenkiania subflava]SME98668.1 Protein of Unknown function [Pseudogulbenkiania subflava DSM 22618]